jgi:c-di-GMP-binding flagellar brake protein YcgR
MEEKRRSKRIKDKVIVSYDSIDGRTIELKAVSEDISETGMKIKINQELYPGQLVGLRLSILGDVIPFTMGGKVIWVNLVKEKKEEYFLAGIDFFEIDKFHAQRLRNYLKRKAS